LLPWHFFAAFALFAVMGTASFLLAGHLTTTWASWRMVGSLRNVKLVSLNVARPRLIVYNGTTINTGICKQPVSGPVQLRTLNLDGDRQADLSVHGGPNKAAYAYPSEHYPFWRQELQRELPWGMFGENFTTSGLSEDEVHVGDRFQIGSAVVVARQPRVPCYKLAAKFRRDDILERFLLSGRSGFYCSVEKEGEVATNASFELLGRAQNAITIAEMNRLFVRDKYNRELLEKALRSAALPEEWHDYFAARLEGRAAEISS
jgi:MOSC domain-containing protein YiiM